MTLCVAVVSRWYPTPDEPTSGVFVARQVDALRRAATVHVLVPVERPFRECVSFTRACGPLSGESTIPVPALSALGTLVRAFVFACALRRLEPKPDVVHLHQLLPDGLSLEYAAARLGVPLVVTEHSNFVAKLLRSRRARIQLNRVLRRAAAITTSSTWVAEQLAQLVPGVDPRPVGVLVDTELFRPRPAATRDFALAVAVRLGEAKGTDLILAAWQRAPEAPRLILVGADPERWEEQAAAAGLGERCRFVGALPPEEVVALMGDAAFLVSASRSETFAGVVAEALACGTPVVATRVGEPVRYVSPEMGILVDSGDIAGLADAVVRMSEEGIPFDPERVHRQIDTLYGPKAFVSRLLGLYADIRSSSD